MANREKILDAAQDLIQTRSFHGFSFQDVAERVGIRKASLYHYFDSKDAVALAVLERGYSIAHKLPEELIVKSSAELQAGDRLRIRFAQGKALCRVEEKE
jgi:AcrR family transcriptional regulator